MLDLHQAVSDFLPKQLLDTLFLVFCIRKFEQHLLVMGQSELNLRSSQGQTLSAKVSIYTIISAKKATRNTFGTMVNAGPWE